MPSDSPGHWWARSTSRAGEVTPLELSRGDQLVLYTDGVTEARGESDRFGDHRLRASLSAVSNPTQTVTKIESALDAFAVGPPQDDAAMLVAAAATQRSPDARRGGARRAAASTGSDRKGFGRRAAG